MLETLTTILDGAGLPYVLIGGHAVNAWCVQRGTDDFDFLVAPNREAIDRVEAALFEAGLRRVRRQDAMEASGPDFLRMENGTRTFNVDFQVAKTDFQSSAIARAITDPGSGVRIATPEDLVVLKLIALRSKDQRDLINLVETQAIDWSYVEQWAPIWDIEQRLADLRGLTGR